MSNYDQHSYCFKNTGATSDFAVTLAWTDPPATPVAFIKLVNNLDLDIISGGYRYIANAMITSLNDSYAVSKFIN